LERKLISIIKKEEYDLLVMTGDYLHKRCYLNEFGDFLNKLNIHKPAFAVPGDNDQDINWNKFFKKTGITFLRNEGVSLDIDGNLINVIGVEKNGVLNINKNGYNIILSHFYDIIDEAKNESEIDLILAGDTHGGQINIPLIGKKVLDLIFKFDYLKGKYNVDGIVLYVNRGIGTSKINVRLRCRPEVALIEVEGMK
jgi:predicted MPP superfamily phosphohydrolase